MNLHLDKAISVFRKVSQVQDELKAYCLEHERPDLPVEEFERAISRMYGLSISKDQVPFEGSFLRGMMERYHDKIVIYIKKNQEEDWKRFATVKELCHVMNDEEEDWSHEGHKTIKNLLAEHRIANANPAAPVVQSETFAEIAATELLYPYKQRLRDLTDLNGDKMTIAKIAIYHKIPEVIVENAISDNYHAMAMRLWSEINS
jgi:Zn-dependent peptidase ImmA (M78 family)